MKKMGIMALAALVLGWGSSCFAEESATPQEVFDLILKAVPVVEQLGEEGLAAFNDPNGEFVYKDTYVLAVDCAKMVMAAHPNEKLVGKNLKGFMDKNPDPAKRKEPNVEMCEAGKQPNGGWTEFYWVKLGDDQPLRKINFSIQVPGTEYTLIAGIYDEHTSLEELNAQLK
ncbi:cache domain-containing protein [Desulfospira joergensenii]|uniref:cache domain-containing protein n=1 Tax=Desulfospira joergensenii TaxID=53329 RepID=UPI0003B3E17C|nr:cache domain-containing protein [Desulfospira joergensenii]